nr:hypothetical protein [Tanacetum cinerariifolium]
PRSRVRVEESDCGSWVDVGSDESGRKNGEEGLQGFGRKNYVL